MAGAWQADQQRKATRNGKDYVVDTRFGATYFAVGGDSFGFVVPNRCLHLVHSASAPASLTTSMIRISPHLGHGG